MCPVSLVDVCRAVVPSHQSSHRRSSVSPLVGSVNPASSGTGVLGSSATTVDLARFAGSRLGSSRSLPRSCPASSSSITITGGGGSCIGGGPLCASAPPHERFSPGPMASASSPLPPHPSSAWTGAGRRVPLGFHSVTSSNASSGGGACDRPEPTPNVAVSEINGSVQMALGTGLGAAGGAAMSRQNAGERLFSLPAATRCRPEGDTTLAALPPMAPTRRPIGVPPPPTKPAARTLSTASASRPTHLSNMSVATMVTSWPAGGADGSATDRVTGTPASTLSGPGPRCTMRSLCSNSSFHVVPTMRCAVHLRLDSVTTASASSEGGAEALKVTSTLTTPPRASLARSM